MMKDWIIYGRCTYMNFTNSTEEQIANETSYMVLRKICIFNRLFS
jgi:hypothetical protein